MPYKSSMVVLYKFPMYIYSDTVFEYCFIF